MAFKNFILTNKGKEMYLSSNSNIGKQITFTKAKIGDGRMDKNDIPLALDIINPWKILSINTARIDNSESLSKLIIGITFSNSEITEEKIMSEIGVFAKTETDDEILFAYSVTEFAPGDEILVLPEAEYPTTFNISVISIINNNTNITNIINPDGFLTKEVIELLKEHIRNIAFRKIQGTLTANQKVIQVPTDILLPISQRAILNIEGEIYFLGRDYRVDVHANTITLNDRYNFKEGTQYEIIDPLPATYVKEQIQEFIDEFKKLVSDSKIDFDKLKDKIYLEFQEKVDSFYLQLDEFIEQNKEDLKGHSIDRIVENGKDENGGNIYNIFRDDDKNVGTMIAPRGPRGNGIINPEYVGKTENGDTEYVLVLEDGTKTTEKIISPKGENGTPFYMKSYPSVADMEADFETDNIDFGEYAVISSNDNDNAKLFEKRTEGFVFIVQIALAGSDGVGIVDKEFIRIDDIGNYVYRDVYSDGNKGPEYIAPIGPRGFTGGTVGEPQPPGSVPYGTIVEWSGDNLPNGWLYTNGATLNKQKYPHLSNVLPGITQPTSPKFPLNITTPSKLNGQVDGFSKYLYSGADGITCDAWSNITDNNSYSCSLSSVMRYSGRISRGNYGSVRYGMKSGVIFDLTLNEVMNISYLKINRKNAEGTYTENSIGTSSNLTPIVDWYLVIDYMDEHGAWIKGVEIHNKTDFIPLGDTISAFMVKSPFKSNKYRIYLDENKTTFNWVYSDEKICFIGELEIGFDKDTYQYGDFIQIPNEKDNQNRYKIIYVGQPLEIQEPTMYSYNIDNIHNGEVPLSLAVENKIPNYSNGITMSEPNILKLGYTNKYNSKSDLWELVKTHENKEGHYYDNLGDLKYSPKSSNWVKWDFINNNWIEDTLLKEKAKKDLLDKYIELEIKRDKMVTLEIDTIPIVEEIEKIKKDLEELNG
ncbi:MAG: phage tail protein [Cetobacterium sp.]|uniref:phage tail protein n=1 Tax=Cetobacterium sp. TaxID=2071632 RepID=UPI003EE62718